MCSDLLEFYRVLQHYDPFGLSQARLLPSAAPAQSLTDQMSRWLKSLEYSIATEFCAEAKVRYTYQCHSVGVKWHTFRTE